MNQTRITTRKIPRPKAIWTTLRPAEIAVTAKQLLHRNQSKPKAVKYLGPLARVSAPKQDKRKRIAPMSQSMKKRRLAYAKKAREFVRSKAKQSCPVMRAVFAVNEPVTEVHHTRGRHGALLDEQRFWLAVSRNGHNWIHANPAQADRQGFIDLKNWGKQ